MVEIAILASAIMDVHGAMPGVGMERLSPNCAMSHPDLNTNCVTTHAEQNVMITVPCITQCTANWTSTDSKPAQVTKIA